MGALIKAITGSLNFLGDLLFSPFSGIPVIGLILFSLISGIILIVLYGKVSNQAALKKVKQRLFCFLLESVLFRHSIKIALKAQSQMLAQTFKYVGLAIPPLIILAVPCILMLAQMNRYFGTAAPQPHEPLTVYAVASDASKLFNIQLTSSNDEIGISTPVRVAKDSTVYWRVLPSANPQSSLILTSTDSPDQKLEFMMESKKGGYEAKIIEPGFNSLLYPANLSVNWLKEVSVSYPQAYYNFLGANLHWIAVFFLISFASGLIASKYMKIEI